MIVGFDYWQVISHFPHYMGTLSAMHRQRGDDVVIISAIGKNRLGTVEAACRALGFQEPVHEVLFDNPSQSPELKLSKCLELGVTVFYDDRDDVCRLLNKHGIMALRVTRKDNSTYDLGAEQ